MPWPAVIVHPTQSALILQTEGRFECPVPQGRYWRRRVIGQFAGWREVDGRDSAQEVESEERKRCRVVCRPSVRDALVEDAEWKNRKELMFGWANAGRCMTSEIGRAGCSNDQIIWI
jgi:hypothetical protein